MSYSQHVTDAHSIVARCAIITLSDTRTAETDTSGKLIRSLLESAGQTVGAYQVLPDDPEKLRALFEAHLSDSSIDAILTAGGTGISKRDQTIDAIENLIDRPLPGFGELFRMLSFEQIGSGAMISRAIGGIARGKLMFAMPGSSKAVELAMTKLILPELRHLLAELRKQS